MPESASRTGAESTASAVLSAYARHLPMALAYATPLARESHWHGPDHWSRVAECAARIAETTYGVDPEVVGAACAYHDVARLDENRDAGHGARSSALISHLHAEGLLGLTDEQAKKLMRAVREHNGGAAVDPEKLPEVACLQDGDRLDLTRVGTTPRKRFMSTLYGRFHAS